jgi:hypothetical protein
MLNSFIYNYLPKRILGLPENAFNLNISLAISESKTITKALFPTQKVTIFPNLFLSLSNSRPKCSLVPRNTINNNKLDQEILK